MRRIFLSIILVALLSATAFFSAEAAPSDDPVSCVTGYYENIGGKNFKASYDLNSKALKNRQNYESWYGNIWSNNIVIRVYNQKLIKKDEKKASVTATIDSLDYSRVNRNLEQGTYKVDSSLVREGGCWRIDGFSVTPEKVFQVEIPEEHEVLANGKAKPFPVEVPIYKGFKMSDPVLVRTSYDDTVRSFMGCLSRIPGVGPDDVYDYYKDIMSKKGWKVNEPAGGGSSLLFQMTKGGRMVSIHSFETPGGGTDEPLDPRGTCLQITWEDVK